MKIKNEEFCKNLVEAMINDYPANGTFVNNSYEKLHQQIYVLADFLTINEFAYNNSEKRNFIFKVIALSKKANGSNKFEDFLEICREKESEKVKPNHFHVVFSFNSSSSIYDPSNPLFYNISPVSIKTYDEKACRHDSIGNDYQKLKGNIDLEKFNWYVFSVKAPTSIIAQNIAVERIENIRALVNFYLISNRIHFQSHPDILTEVFSSVFIYTTNEDNEVQLVSHSSEFDMSRFYYDNPETIGNLLVFLNAYSKIKKCQLKEIVSSCIRIYTVALDSKNREYMFLMLWSIIDVLLPDIKNNYKILCNIFVKENDFIRALVSAMYNKRNLLVHQGHHEIFDLEDINNLKQIIDNLLYFCIKFIPKLASTTELSNLLLKLSSKENIRIDKKLLKIIDKLDLSEMK